MYNTGIAAKWKKGWASYCFPKPHWKNHQTTDNKLGKDDTSVGLEYSLTSRTNTHIQILERLKNKQTTLL